MSAGVECALGEHSSSNQKQRKLRLAFSMQETFSSGLGSVKHQFHLPMRCPQALKSQRQNIKFPRDDPTNDVRACTGFFFEPNALDLVKPHIAPRRDEVRGISIFRVRPSVRSKT